MDQPDTKRARVETEQQPEGHDEQMPEIPPEHESDGYEPSIAANEQENAMPEAEGDQNADPADDVMPGEPQSDEAFPEPAQPPPAETDVETFPSVPPSAHEIPVPEDDEGLITEGITQRNQHLISWKYP